MGEFVNLWSFIIQFINICIIIYILNRFLFKPYLGYLKEEELKRKELEEAHSTMEELKKCAKVEAKWIIDDAKKEALTIKKQNEIVARQEATNLVEEAKNEATKIKSKAMQDIDNERKTLYSDLRDKVLDVALKLNEKLFTKSDANADFIKKTLEKEKI